MLGVNYFNYQYIFLLQIVGPLDSTCQKITKIGRQLDKFLE